MKKIFLAICFMTMLMPQMAGADIQPLVEGRAKRPRIQQNAGSVDAMLPNPRNETEVRDFFKKRLENAIKSEVPEDADLNSPVSVNVIHTPEYYQAKEEAEKPLFQRMYEKTLASFRKDEEDKKTSAKKSDPMEREIAKVATRFFKLSQEKQAHEVPQIPTVGVTLPSGRRILAPAREHIAYFLSYIDIQANGYLKVEDTITLVANNNKFAYGLARAFPKYSGKFQHIDLVLEDVTVNGTKVPYTAEEIGDSIMLKPKYNQRLQPGVYTYVFTYVIANQLTSWNDEQFLDWNVVGRPMDCFITSANAIVSLPSGRSFREITNIVGTPSTFTERRTNRYNLAENVVAFSNSTPMLNNESMHVVALVDNDVFIKDFNKSFTYFITNWGNILYASIGLLAILMSFILSLLTLKYERKKKKYTPSYNGSLMRSILVSKYDRIAFVAQILDLFRKNAVDIKQDNNRIFLLKKNTDSSRLNKEERKALSRLFAKKIDSVEVNNANNVLLKRVKHIFEKAAGKQIKKYKIMHNISYVIFSVLMLLLTEIFISYISVNFAQTLIILLATTLLYAFYVWILRHSFKKWYLTVPIKVLTLVALFAIWGFSSIYVGGICSFIVLIMVSVIFAFTRIFGEQNSFVNEAKEAISRYKEYLIGNADAINLSRDFINQQSNVFALGIEEYFPQNVGNKNSFRLDVADILKQKLIDII